MLDLYSITDDELQIDEPNEADYLGSFSLEEFKQLENILLSARKLEINWAYFEDTRLSHHQVKVLLDLLEKDIKSNLLTEQNRKWKVYQKLERFLTILVQEGKGMICFCD